MVVDVNVVVVKEKFSRACRAFIIVGTCFPNFRASTVRTLNSFDFFTHVYFSNLNRYGMAVWGCWEARTYRCSQNTTLTPAVLSAKGMTKISIKSDKNTASDGIFLLCRRLAFISNCAISGWINAVIGPAPAQSAIRHVCINKPACVMMPCPNDSVRCRRNQKMQSKTNQETTWWIMLRRVET